VFYTDQELDAATGLYNYDARLYDPVIGRFLSADPYVQSPLNPQSLNRYSYVLNNPLIYTDPTGHWFRDPNTGENVPSDPSSYDVDSGETPPKEHVDYRDGDDPGEKGWSYSEREGWTTIIKAPGSRVGRKIDAYGHTLNHVLLPEEEVLPNTEYQRAQEEFARSILRPFNDLSMALGVRKQPSPNQLNQQIKKGKAPNGVERVDVGKVKGEQTHVHFNNGAALNQDGTWKHGQTTITKKQADWLERAGWTIPK
jgi:RHS repeat-associated protein